MHHDSFALILLQLVLVVGLGMVGRLGARAYNQPEVLGELLIAVLFANLVRLAGGSLESTIHGLNVFAGIGSVLLLFNIGLNINLEDLLRVGPQSMRVAVVGVVCPMVLGLLCGLLLMPQAGIATHLFLGAALAATSVAVTARAFKDLGVGGSKEAKLVLGAAVIDDVIGLILLTVVTSLAGRGQFDFMSLVKTMVVAGLFLGAVIFFGQRLAGTAMKSLGFLESPNRRLLLPLVFCFMLAWLANEAGLAAIIGALAAGIVLRDEHFPANGPKVGDELAPLEALFVPVFFVIIGLQVDLSVLLNFRVFLFAAILCVAAVLGKMACAWVSPPDTDGVTVGIAMVPRGEVGLIFAGVGKHLNLLDEETFSAIVIMVIFTTILTLPALRWSVARTVKS